MDKPQQAVLELVENEIYDYQLKATRMQISDFKLLGCTIDDKLHFDKHVKNLKSSVCSKLFAKKNLFFYLSILKSTFLKPFYFHILTIAHRYLFIFQIFWLIN